MTNTLSVAEAKSRFSEILSRVRYAHDFFVIKRKGKPVAALVDVHALRQIETQSAAKTERGLSKIQGAWKEFKNLDEVVSGIYKQRNLSKGREVRF